MSNTIFSSGKCNRIKDILITINKKITDGETHLQIWRCLSSASSTGDTSGLRAQQHSQENAARRVAQRQANLEKKKQKEAKRLEMIERTKLKEQKARGIQSGQHLVQYTAKTEPGAKKDVSCPLPDAYHPQFVEAAWYDWWTQSGFFKPRPMEDTEETFVLCLPPPNVTGKLHLGHALTAAVQDSIVRWYRMHGRTVLWNPGCDHAGIATQVVVERRVRNEQNMSRWELGREKFVEEVWRWRNEKGVEIYDQLKKLACSLDWDRDCFTMDKNFSAAVEEAFIRLHDEGLIYRSQRLVNWCCTLESVISDIEVDHINISGPTKMALPGYERKVQFGTLISFAYPVVDSDEEIVVATTRLETMLGDVAVSVHPRDDRYSHLIGRLIQHPFCDRQLPVIADECVNPEFGTGAVKVTPAHDPSDYDMGLRHGLPSVQMMDNRGHISPGYGAFSGLKRFHARDALLKAIKSVGLYRGVEANPMSIPVCSRSGDVIEPLIKSQWFVNCQQMAAQALQAVDSAELSLIPKNYEAQWCEWLSNIQDWCISRQLWWGHRIPAYRAQFVDGAAPVWVAAGSQEEALEKLCRQRGISPDGVVMVTRDEDVLDTWFSSSLFPFAMLGWPQQTMDLQRFYPTSLLETGGDILFFWVARMVMMGLKLTGTLPFKEVLLHGVLRDASGRKMSKSLGNVIDPMDVIQGRSLQELNDRLDQSNLDPSEVSVAKSGQQRDFPLGIPECGTDALRFTLCSYNFKAHFINMDVSHVSSNRRFCNKIWQTFRFTIKHLGENYQPGNRLETQPPEGVINKWIMGRLVSMLDQCDRHFRAYDLHLASKALHNFWYAELCDVYLECVKPVLSSGDQAAIAESRDVLYTCVHTALKASHPFMPYITEELFQRLPRSPSDSQPSICVSQYPTRSPHMLTFDDLHDHMTSVLGVVSSILSVKKDLNIGKLPIPVYVSNTGLAGFDINDFQSVIQSLARSGQVMVNQPPPLEGVFAFPVHDSHGAPTFQVALQLKGTVDLHQMCNDLDIRCRKFDESLTKMVEKMMRVEQDTSRALLEEKMTKANKERQRIQKLRVSIQELL